MKILQTCETFLLPTEVFDLLSSDPRNAKYTLSDPLDDPTVSDPDALRRLVSAKRVLSSLRHFQRVDEVNRVNVGGVLRRLRKILPEVGAETLVKIVEVASCLMHAESTTQIFSVYLDAVLASAGCDVGEAGLEEIGDILRPIFEAEEIAAVEESVAIPLSTVVPSPTKRTRLCWMSQEMDIDGEMEQLPPSGGVMSPRLDSFDEKQQRSRKSVERLVPSPALPSKSGSRKLVGKGTRLGDIAKVDKAIKKVSSKSEALKRLHKVMFGSDGTEVSRKRDVRGWTGTEEGTAAMKATLAGTKSLKLVSEMARLLGLSGSGERSTVESRIADFLVSPDGKPLSPKKRKIEKSKKTSSRSTSGPVSGTAATFSAFLQKRAPEMAALGLSAREVTELLALEWKNLAKEGTRPAVKKAVKKDGKKDIAKGAPTSPSSSSDSDSSSSDGSSSSGSSGRSSSSSSDASDSE